MEQTHIQTAIDYKKNIAGKFVLMEGAKLKQRVEGGKAFMLNASDEKQIREIFAAEIAENVKKGWEEV